MFQLKLIHRIVISRKELFIFGIKTDHDESLHCEVKDSIENTFIECPFKRFFAKNKLIYDGFNNTNCCQISPTTEVLLFDIIPSSKETKLTNKFNNTTLSMRYTYVQTKSILSYAPYGPVRNFRENS